VYIRSGAGVGHGKDTGASVLQLEVLILELLAVDGLSTSALWTVRLVSCIADGCDQDVRCHG
jgi:hypothetical protein